MEKSKGTRSAAESIRNFLDKHQTKLPEARGFLQFLLSRDEILRRIEVVDDLEGRPNGILVSAKGSGTWPFLYRRGDRCLFKVAQASLDLMKYVPDPLYLHLSADPPAWTPDRQEFLDMLARWHDELFQAEVEWLNRRVQVLARIDEALDRRDRSGFERWCAELRRLDATTP